MTLSEKITRLRKTAQLSQEQLAERLNISRQTVSRWEMGSAMPDASNLLQLSKLFGVSIDYLLHDDFESDEDLPKVRAVRQENSGQIMMYLIILEVMALLIQFMTTVILENWFFALLSFIPFAALIGGFEYAYRKSKADEGTARFRLRLYKISAWLGLYFPVRLLVVTALQFFGWTPSLPLQECLVLVLYIAASAFVNLSLDAQSLKK